jgi:serine/threonine-protein kinase
VKSNRRVTKTQVGMVKGNANFMSPEQARGHAVDCRSDLFSLALVLYYCLTNELLYDGANDLDVLYRAATGPTEADYEKIRQLPEPAAQILEKALAFGPDERFQSSNEFASMLAAHIGGGKSDASNLMQLLFGDELRKEAA